MNEPKTYDLGLTRTDLKTLEKALAHRMVGLQDALDECETDTSRETTNKQIKSVRELLNRVHRALYSLDS